MCKFLGILSAILFMVGSFLFGMDYAMKAVQVSVAEESVMLDLCGNIYLHTLE